MRKEMINFMYEIITPKEAKYHLVFLTLKSFHPYLSKV